MTDHSGLDAHALRQKASAFRRLAGEILDGDFRRSLLRLAFDYDRQAARLDRTIGHDGGQAAEQGTTKVQVIRGKCGLADIGLSSLGESAGKADLSRSK
jgi:hypothetical protein